MKKFHNFLIAIMFLIMLATLWIGYEMIYPFKPLVFNDDRFPVLNAGKTLHVGDTLEYLVRYCKNVSKPAHVNYQLVNSVIYLSSVEKTANTAPGCGEHVNQFVIPEINGEGEYSLEMIVQYQMSPFRTITVTGATEEFRIVK